MTVVDAAINGPQLKHGIDALVGFITFAPVVGTAVGASWFVGNLISKQKIIKMLLFDNMFASTYNYYSKFKNETPLGSSICVVFVSQITLFVLLIILIGKKFDTNFFMYLPNKYYYIPLFIIWFFILYKYYTREKAIEILNKFKSKTPSSRMRWGILTVMLFILPTILIFMALKK